MEKQNSERPRALRPTKSDEKLLVSLIIKMVEEHLKEHPEQTWLENDLISFDFGFEEPKKLEKTPEK